MSLLMEALRKAEEAKRRTSEQFATEARSATKLTESLHTLSAENEQQARADELTSRTNTTLGSPQNPPAPQQSPATMATHTLNQRSASALFLAKQRAQRRQQQRQRVAVLLSFLLLLPVAGGLFYWWQIQIASTTGITTSLPQSISISSQVLDITNAPDNQEVASLNDNTTTDNPTMDSQTAASQVLRVEGLEEAGNRVAGEAQESSLIVSNVTEPPNETAPLTEDIPDNSDRILSLRHRDSTLVVSPELSSAYEYFLNGNLPAATADYLLLLESDPDNRQAMLGLATIYRRRGDIAAAQSLYARLLEMNPRDPLARTGLINAASSADPLQRASDLRQLQETYPSLAPITFALGNLHASQGRWREAQSAYFDALRKARDSGDGPISPDYAFNLAISLERLGEPTLAYDYYQQAERLAQVVAPAFDRTILQQRLQALQ